MMNSPSGNQDSMCILNYTSFLWKVAQKVCRNDMKNISYVF